MSNVSTPRKILLQPLQKTNSIEKKLEPVKGLVLKSKKSYGNLKDADFHQNEEYFNQDKQFQLLTRNEIIQNIVNNFTNDYKRLMKEFRQLNDIGDEFYLEPIEDVYKILDEPKKLQAISAEKKAKISLILKDSEYFCDAVSPEPLEQEVVSELSYNYMSGIWNLLGDKCKNQPFEISPIDYDAHNQPKPHWMDCPQIELEALDKSRVKCTKWLEDNFVDSDDEATH